MTEKFTAELDGEKQRFETQTSEKNEMEMEYEDRIKNMDERHAAATQQMEAQYQHKIMAEVERYALVLSLAPSLPRSLSLSLLSLSRSLSLSLSRAL